MSWLEDFSRDAAALIQEDLGPGFNVQILSDDDIQVRMNYEDGWDPTFTPGALAHESHG